METKINIAEILKNKPKGTKLHSSVYGDVKLELITEEDSKYPVITMVNAVCGIEYISFTENGLHYEGYPGAELALFPSSKMRDWSKFAWKKGDVLTNSSGFKVFFDKWVNEDYTKFLGKIKILGYSYYYYYDTAYYTLVSKEEALEFIKNVEEINNDILNSETLKIEKLEFKDGDIVCISGMGYLAYGIVKSIDNSSKKLEYYVLNDMSTLKFEDWLSFEDKHIQPITETQRMILFDSLAKEGKAWDAEKKQVVELKPKVEIKPFDQVLVRNDKEDQWSANIFSYQVRDMYHCLGECYWKYCIPYNEETAHLLGTTDEWKGGEG